MPFFRPKKRKGTFDFKPPQKTAAAKVVSVEEQISIDQSRCVQMMAAAEAAVKARNFVQAEDLYYACLPIMEQVYAGDSKAMAECLTALGDVYYWQDKFGLALPIYQRLLAMRERMKESSPASLVSAYFKVAKAQEHLSNLEEARDMFKRASDIAQKTLVLGHPLLTSVLEAYGNFLQEKTTNHGLAEDIKRKARTSRDTYVDPQILKNAAEGKVGEEKWKEFSVSGKKDPTLWLNLDEPESNNPIVRALRKLREHPRLAMAFLTLPVSIGLLVVTLSAAYYLTGGEQVQTPLVHEGEIFRSVDARQSLKILKGNKVSVKTKDEELKVEYVTLSNPWRELQYYYLEPHTRDVVLYPKKGELRDTEGNMLRLSSDPITSTTLEMEQFSNALHKVNSDATDQTRIAMIREFCAKFTYENPYTHNKEAPNVVFGVFEDANSAKHFVDFLHMSGTFDLGFMAFRGRIKFLGNKPANTTSLIKCIIVPDLRTQSHASFFVLATNRNGQLIRDLRTTNALVISSTNGIEPEHTVGADEHINVSSTSRIVFSKVTKESINAAVNLLAWVLILLPIFAIFYKVFEPRFNRASYENNRASLEVYLSYIYLVALAAYICYFTATVFYVMSL